MFVCSGDARCGDAAVSATVKHEVISCESPELQICEPSSIRSTADRTPTETTTAETTDNLTPVIDNAKADNHCSVTNSSIVATDRDISTETMSVQTVPQSADCSTGTDTSLKQDALHQSIVQTLHRFTWLLVSINQLINRTFIVHPLQ